MKILLAQSNAENVYAIEAMLIADGHELISVTSGSAAMAAMDENPHLVILEANLPEISGFECCRLIKHDDKHGHKPVILVMPNQDSTEWARFSECGADDFFEHSLTPLVLRVKIRLLQRLNELYQRLNDGHRHAEQEIFLAKHMFDAITKRQPKDVDFLHFWSLSAGHFCGDLFIYERTPENHLHILLADFTGHGLAAAMGAMPVSDIFFAMTRKGSGIEQIIEEINDKLYEILPTGKFCAATVLRLDADYSKLEIWNGGLPPVLLADRQLQIAYRCESFHLPLGIAEPEDFNSQTEKFDLSGIQSVVLYSDGLVEAQNSLGEYFGEDKLSQVISRKLKDANTFNKIKLSALAFLEGLEPQDDISLAVINID